MSLEFVKVHFADFAHDQREDALKPRRRMASLAGLAIALVLPVIIAATVKRHLQSDPTWWLLIGNAAYWGVALLLLAIVIFWEKRSPSSIGLVRPTGKAFIWGAAAVVGVAIFSVATGAVMAAAGLHLDDEQQNRLLAGSAISLQAFVVVSAGCTEEIIFRGYAIERVLEMTRSRWLGVLLPGFAFGAIHIPLWGIAHAVVAGVSGLGFALVYLWRRNLWTNITAHVLFDGLALAALALTPVLPPDAR